MYMNTTINYTHSHDGVLLLLLELGVPDAGNSVSLLVSVGFFGSDDLEPLLVLLGSEVSLHDHVCHEVASTRHTVVLPETGLLLINLLVGQLLILGFHHVGQHNLVKVARIRLLVALFGVHLFLCGVTGPTLFSTCSSHLLLFSTI